MGPFYWLKKNVGAELWYLPEDFARLENDPSIDKLYVNSGFDYWYIHAEASSSS